VLREKENRRCQYFDDLNPLVSPLVRHTLAVVSGKLILEALMMRSESGNLAAGVLIAGDFTSC
jgi:hypothetical protein